MNRAYRRSKLIAPASVLLLLILTILLYIASLDAILRYGVASHIAVADFFLHSGRLYPNTDSGIISSVNVYFPGSALLTAFIIKLGAGAIIFEIMLFISCLLFLYLVWLLSSVSMIIKTNEYDQRVLFSLLILFSLIFCNDFMLFALQFKPDTIYLCIGISALLVAHKINQKSPFVMFILGLAFSASLLFKQQAIVGLIVVIFFSVVIDRKWKFFGLGTTLGILTILSIYSQISDLFYWTIGILSNDGFLNLREWMGAHLEFYLCILGLFSLVYLTGQSKEYKKQKNSFFWLIYQKIMVLKMQPVLLFLVASAAVSFISGLKQGGNSANSQLSLFLLSPFLLTLIPRSPELDYKILMTICILLVLPYTGFGYLSYSRTLEARERVQIIIKKSDRPKIVYATNLYFLIRHQTEYEQLKDYFTINLERELPWHLILKDAAETLEPDFLLIETKSNSISEMQTRSIKNFITLDNQEGFRLLGRN